MNPILCGIHVNNLLKAGQYPIVIEKEKKIVGNIELFVGKENGVNKMHIGVLQVHLDWRNCGLGRILLN